MTEGIAERVQQSYSEVAAACGINNARHKPWASSNDAILLEKILKGVDKETDRILDLGCCGYPWITNFLHREGYNVVGVDVYKPHWFDNELIDQLGISLVAYDGHNAPFKSDSFDVVLMFGVLEHIGVWKNDGEKYQDPQPEVTKHRQKVLDEVHRILTDDGVLYVTKFPNTFGRDKYLSKLVGGDVGHLNSERARPDYLHEVIGESFEINSLFANGLLPHRIPLGTPSYRLPMFYGKLDLFLSNLPVIKQFSQNYCIIASPK